jgi:hypothetical protein
LRRALTGARRHLWLGEVGSPLELEDYSRFAYPCDVDLPASIEGLYAAFARYPLRARIEGCPHCDLGQNERGLHAAPLRRLRREDLDVYPFKAMTTFGDVDDFRHFLPRIAELLIEGAIGAADLGVVAGKLAYGEWTRWPQPERAAVLAWLDALERAYLDDAVPHVFAHDVLDANLTLRGDAGPFLARWPGATGKRAIEDLAEEVRAIAMATNTGHGSGFVGLIALRDELQTAFTRAIEHGHDDVAIQDALEILAFPPFSG